MTRSERAAQGFGAAVFAVVLMLTLLAIADQLSLTGFLVAEKTITQTLDLHISSANATYAEIPLALDAPPSSVSVSGVIVGTGPVAVLLEIEGKRYVVLNQSASGNGNGNFLSISGQLVRDIRELHTTVPIFDFVPNATDESDAAAGRQVESADKSIEIVLEYNSGTAFDPDDDGIDTSEGSIDYTVHNTAFSWPVPEENLCTRWQIAPANKDTSTVICNGNAACCSLAELAPVSNNWQTLNIPYGAYGTGFNNTVSAQVIYANYTLEITEPAVDVVSSGWSSLQAVFLPVTRFSNKCVETCALSGTSRSAKLIVSVQDAVLVIDSLTYKAAFSENAAPKALPIPAQSIKQNATLTLNLSRYFYDAEGDELMFAATYTLADIADVSINGSIAAITHAKNFAGTALITFTASDLNSTTGNTAELTVYLDNRPPYFFADIGNMTTGARILLPEHFKDPDSDELTYNATVIGDVKIDIADGTASILAENGFKGTAFAFITASDLDYSAVSNTFNITRSNITDKDETLVQGRAVINEPVSWKKIITLVNESSTTTEIPKEAINITVRENNESIAGSVKVEREERIGKKVETLDSHLKTVAASREKLLKDTVDENITLVIEENATELEVEYQTPAPIAMENETDSTRKQINISSETHYENITAYTDIRETPENFVKLFALVNGTKVEITGIKKIDTNSNGLIDRVEWIVPSLSSILYEVEIFIFNVYTKDFIERNWTVEFNATGIGNLTITAANGTSYSGFKDGVQRQPDLEFVQFSCGETVIAPEVLTDGSHIVGYSVRNLECNQTMFHTATVKTNGRHVQHFNYSGAVAEAFYDVLSPDTVVRVARKSISDFQTQFAWNSSHFVLNWTDSGSRNELSYRVFMSANGNRHYVPEDTAGCYALSWDKSDIDLNSWKQDFGLTLANATQDCQNLKNSMEYLGMDFSSSNIGLLNIDHDAMQINLGSLTYDFSDIASSFALSGDGSVVRINGIKDAGNITIDPTVFTDSAIISNFPYERKIFWDGNNWFAWYIDSNVYKHNFSSDLVVWNKGSPEQQPGGTTSRGDVVYKEINGFDTFLFIGLRDDGTKKYMNFTRGNTFPDGSVNFTINYSLKQQADACAGTGATVGISTENYYFAGQEGNNCHSSTFPNNVSLNPDNGDSWDGDWNVTLPSTGSNFPSSKFFPLQNGNMMRISVSAGDGAQASNVTWNGGVAVAQTASTTFGRGTGSASQWSGISFNNSGDIDIHVVFANDTSLSHFRSDGGDRTDWTLVQQFTAPDSNLPKLTGPVLSRNDTHLFLYYINVTPEGNESVLYRIWDNTSWSGEFTLVNTSTVKQGLTAPEVSNNTDIAVGWSEGTNPYDFVIVNHTHLQIELDTTPPNNSIQLPAAMENISGSFTINVSVNDTESDVPDVNISLLRPGSVHSVSPIATNLSVGSLKSGYRNVTIDTVALGIADGVYNLSSNATDSGSIPWTDEKSRNTNISENVSITIDNNVPNVSIMVPVSGSTQLGSFLINSSVNDSGTGVMNVTFRLHSAGGTTSAWLDVKLYDGNADNGHWNMTFDSTAIADGEYNITINATDFVKNQNVTNATTVTIDNTPPNISVITPASGTVQRGTIQINGSVNETTSGVLNVTYRLQTADGDTVLDWLDANLSDGTLFVGSWNATLITTNTGDDEYNITINATDVAGNQNVTNASTITIDNDPANVSITVPVNRANISGNLLINVSVNETGTVTVSAVNATLLNSSGNQTGLIPLSLSSGTTTSGYWNATIDTTAFPEGSYNITVNASNSNLFPTVTGNVSVVFDNTIPNISIINLVNDSVHHTDFFLINISANDTQTNLVNVSVRIMTPHSATEWLKPDLYVGDRANGYWNISFDANQINASHYNITINATDFANNQYIENFTQLRNVPFIDYIANTAANDSALNQSFILINVTIVETNISNITFALYNASTNVTNITSTNDTALRLMNFTDLNPHELYYYNVTVISNNTAENTTETRTIRLDNRVPSFVNLTEPLDMNVSPQTVNFTWIAIDELSPPLTCSLVINDTTNISDVSTANNTLTNYTLRMNQGTYNWSINCSDRAENVNTSATFTFSIDVNAPDVTVTSPLNDTYTNTVLNISFTASDATGIANCSVFHNATGAYLRNATNESVTRNSNTEFSISGVNDGVQLVWAVECADAVVPDANVGITVNYTATFDTTAPASFTLTTPVNDTITTNTSPTFVWAAATESNFANYTLQIANISTFAAINATYYALAASSNTSLVPGVALANDIYWYWRVTAYDLASNSFTSQPFVYITDNSAPLIELVVNPATAELAEENISINWTARDIHLNESYVNISYADNGTFIRQLTENSTFNTSGLLVANYSIRLYAIDNASNTNTTVQNATTQDTTPPGVFTLLTPADNAVENNFTPTFTWEAAAEAKLANYTIEVTNSSSFAWVNFSNNATTEHYDSTDVLISDITWYWRVKAFDTAGNQRTSTDAFRYLHDNASPTIGGETRIPAAVLASSDVTVNASVSDARVSVVVVEGNWTGSLANTTVTNNSGGLYSYVIGSSELEGNEVVQWKYYANDTGGNTAEGTLQTFTVSNTVPGNTTLLLPANGSVQLHSSVIIAWTASSDDDGDTITYDLLIDDNADLATPHVNITGISGTTRTVTENLTSGQMFYAVRSNDAQNVSNFSGIHVMEVVIAAINITIDNLTQVFPGDVVRVNVSELNGTGWINEVNITIRSTNYTAADVGSNTWEYNYTVENITAQNLDITAYAFNDTTNSTAASRVTVQVLDASPALPVITLLCSNHTYALNNTNITVEVVSNPDTLLSAINVSIIMPNTSVVMPLHIQNGSTGLTYYHNYTYYIAETGNFTIEANITDIANQSAQKSSTFHAVNGTKHITLNDTTGINVTFLDVCTGFAFIIDSDFTVAENTLFDGKVETSLPTFIFRNLNLTGNVSTVLNYTDLGKNLTAPSGTQTVAQFEANTSLTDFGSVQITYNYSALSSAVADEGNLAMYRCPNVSSCTFVLFNASADTANNIMTGNSTNLSGFIITEPTVTETVTQTVTTTVSGGGGGGGGTTTTVKEVIALDIIAPGTLSLFAEDQIITPIEVFNKGNLTLNRITLTALSNTTDVTPELTKDYVEILNPGETDYLDLILTSHSIPGRYEVAIVADVEDPDFTDSVKLFVELLDRFVFNKTLVIERLTFARDLFKENPECLEIQSVLREAEAALENEEFEKAQRLTEASINACKDLITNLRQKKVVEVSRKVGVGLTIGAVATSVSLLLLEFVTHFAEHAGNFMLHVLHIGRKKKPRTKPAPPVTYRRKRIY